MGVDIIDTAVASMSGLTSQPSANSLYYGLNGFNRNLRADIEGLEELSHYWVLYVHTTVTLKVTLSLLIPKFIIMKCLEDNIQI